MDADRRRALEERRQFNKARVAARALHERAEPAFSALSAAGEDFKLYPVGQEPRWLPGWVPRGWGRMHWHELDDVGWSEEDLDRAALARTASALLAERIGEDETMLVVGQFVLELTRGAFDRHAEAILEAHWESAYLASPPAQWMIEIKRHMAYYKDG